MSVDLIDTTEMYLKTVYEMEEDGITPLRARIVERLGHSGPTVSQTVARMERDGLLKVREDRRLELTEDGRAVAREVVRKHRLAERLLVDVIGLDWALAHEEACRWEHVMSKDVEERLLDLIEDPSCDPYGNPLPGVKPTVAKELSVEELLQTLPGANTEKGTVVRVSRLGEPVQAAEGLLGQLQAEGVVPGADVHLVSSGDRILVSSASVTDASSEFLGVSMPRSLASHLFVSAD